ncbi:hypothetical protein HWV62_30851 [Athelia sp. TMB]|nr:hypothetical protein HWV62_30851 [Athelia sp. TMB]
MSTTSNGHNAYPLNDTITRDSLDRVLAGVDEDDHVHLASLAEKKRLWWRNAVINLAFIASWFIFATVLSVYNKWMFSPDHFAFPYPLFVTTLHMFVQFLLSASLRVFFPAKFRPDRSPSKKDFMLKVVPTAVATCLDIGLSNLSLKTITLTFYTMCKSSSLIFVLGFAFLLRLETFSYRLVGVIFLIFSGVVLMVATETHFVLSGLILVLSASALGGLRWSLSQILLKDKKMGMDNPAATIFWLAPVMGVTLAIISLFIDGWMDVFRSDFFADFWKAMNTMLFLLAPGVVAFCMLMSEFYIVQRAGVVPMSIAGIAKEVTTITISAWFFGDELTPLNITGVAITTCGIALYTYHKYEKSLNSTVPLDAHGNPLASDEDLASYVELEQTDGMETSSMLRGASEADTESTYANREVLFSADNDGEEDAEEYRSIRSAKMNWTHEPAES